MTQGEKILYLVGIVGALLLLGRLILKYRGRHRR
jgi:hypothetical protein